MPHQVTVTAPVGPGRTATAQVLQNVVDVEFDLINKVLHVQQVQSSEDNIKDYDLAAAATITCTITGGNFAFVIS